MPDPDGRPGMSANSTVAGTRFRGLYILVRTSRRGSGTRAIPSVASIRPCARGASWAAVMSWNRAVFPVDG